MREAERFTPKIGPAAASCVVKYHECDQITLDILDTEREMLEEYGIVVSLPLHAVESMIETVVPFYPSDDFEEILEYTLDRHESFQNEMQRKGFKRVLGKVFGRRGAFAREQMRQLTERCGSPF